MESAAAPPPENPLIEHALFFLRNRQARERTLVIFSSDGKACTVTSLPTRQEVICCGIQLYFGLPIFGNHNNKTSAEIEQEHRVKQFARRVARGSVPRKNAVSRVVKYAKDKELKPETFIQWIKEALEYKYPL